MFRDDRREILLWKHPHRDVGREVLSPARAGPRQLGSCGEPDYFDRFEHGPADAPEPQPLQEGLGNAHALDPLDDPEPGRSGGRRAPGPRGRDVSLQQESGRPAGPPRFGSPGAPGRLVMGSAETGDRAPQVDAGRRPEDSAMGSAQELEVLGKAAAGRTEDHAGRGPAVRQKSGERERDERESG